MGQEEAEAGPQRGTLLRRAHELLESGKSHGKIVLSWS